ncbi:MAG: two-component system, sporulation sensor kinase [Actinomycetota bacterium]|nr:two-component system, sporulation sensor kinase [Actinomycetota bacterium]
MQPKSIPELLAAWRAAERRWEQPAPADEVRAAALEVIAAWVAYQDAAVAPEAGEFMLVADDNQTYVGATRGVTAILGYGADELIGRRVEDIAAPQLQAETPAQWAAFLAEGRQDGGFRLRAKDGQIISLRYQARAHHPVPGFHMSRLWLDVSTSLGAVRISASGRADLPSRSVRPLTP